MEEGDDSPHFVAYIWNCNTVSAFLVGIKSWNVGGVNMEKSVVEMTRRNANTCTKIVELIQDLAEPLLPAFK